MIELRCASDRENDHVNGSVPEARNSEHPCSITDAAQYHLDVIRFGGNSDVVYGALNVIMRRKPKENNFKSVLECISDLMNDGCTIPVGYMTPFSGMVT